MVIGTNVSSLTAQRSLEQSTRAMGTAMERLATGTKINSASDDAAGLALANRMSSQASSLGIAVKNMADGIALTEAIEGSLEEVTDILQRMRSLAVQAASDTTAAKDRNTLNAEMSSLKNELTGLASRSTYAGQNVIDGSFTGKNIQVGTESAETIAISQGSVAATALGGFTQHSRTLDAGVNSTISTARSTASALTDTFTITPSGGSATDAFAGTEQSAKEVAAAVNLVTGTTGVTATAYTAVQLGSFTAGESVDLVINGQAIAATQLESDAATFVSRVNQFTATTGVVATKDSATTILLVASDGRNIEIERDDAGTNITVQNLDRNNTANGASTANLTAAGGASEFAVAKGQISLSSSSDFEVTQAGTSKSFFATDTTAATAFVNDATLDSRSNASAALASIDGAIDKVSQMRADLGAISNRLTHAKDAAVILRENTEAGVSRLRDADYAQESANLAKAQVLQQVGTAMLAQANAQPQLVLQLVQ